MINRFSKTLRATAASLALMAGISAPGSIAPARAAPEDALLAEFLAMATPDLKPYYQVLFMEGYRNAVLNFDRLGLMELERGHVGRARWAFEKATDQINLIYANDPNAQAAKSAWSAEEIKDFKGEPYERSMAFYYLGVTDLLKGDYQNARASFLQSQYQDTFSEDEKFQGDFAISAFLTGWASQCDGSNSVTDENFGYALQASPGLIKPAPNHNLLMIAEIGSGPTKFGVGKYNEALRMALGTNQGITGAHFAVGGGDLAAAQATNVSFQATTRGGRPIQDILDTKAVVKDLAAAGSLRAVDTTNAKSRMRFAAGFGGQSPVDSLIVARAAKAAADIRYWDNLPDDVAVATTFSAMGPFSAVTVSSVGAKAVTTKALVGGNAICTLAWARLATPSGLPPIGPNTELAGQAKLSQAMLDKNAAFRDRLLRDGVPE